MNLRGTGQSHQQPAYFLEPAAGNTLCIIVLRSRIPGLNLTAGCQILALHCLHYAVFRMDEVKAFRGSMWAARHACADRVLIEASLLGEHCL